MFGIPYTVYFTVTDMYVFLISLRLSIRVVHMGQFFWPDPILPVTLRTRPDPSPLPTQWRNATVRGPPSLF